MMVTVSPELCHLLCASTPVARHTLQPDELEQLSVAAQQPEDKERFSGLKRKVSIKRKESLKSWSKAAVYSHMLPTYNVHV